MHIIDSQKPLGTGLLLQRIHISTQTPQERNILHVIVVKMH